MQVTLMLLDRQCSYLQLIELDHPLLLSHVRSDADARFLDLLFEEPEPPRHFIAPFDLHINRKMLRTITNYSFRIQSVPGWHTTSGKRSGQDSGP